MKKGFVICTLLLLTWQTYHVQAQSEASKAECETIKNKKAVKAYKEGIDRRSNKFHERLAYLKKALELEPKYIAANFAYATEKINASFYEGTSLKPIQPYLELVVDSCQQFHSDPYYFLGIIHYEENNWDTCAHYFKKFLNFLDEDEKKFNRRYEEMLSNAKTYHRNAKFFSKLYGNPVPFDPQPVKGVCTEHDEYLPIISPDDRTIYFTRKLPVSSGYKSGPAGGTKEEELFSFSKRSASTGEFDRGGPMSYPFNQRFNEGGATISINNSYLYFTICQTEPGGTYYNCDIYHSYLVDGEWTEPKKVEGINDPERWDSQPSLAADGKTLYFSSNRKGGFGGVDIWKAVKDEATNKWSEPVNVGRPINTRKDEFSPFIHSDFNSLYFSSEGHLGAGKLDIFFSKVDDSTGLWTKPKNIGVPINTEEDDLGFFVSTDGKYGYFATNDKSKVKGKGMGKHDLFMFELYPEARPDEVIFVQGSVANNAEGKSKHFSVQITDAVTNEKTDAMVDTLTGNYMAIVNVSHKNDLLVSVTKDNAAFNSQLISKEEVQATADKIYKENQPVAVSFDALKANLTIDSVELDRPYSINDIFYRVNSAELDPRSVIVVEQFAAYLMKLPTINIEIHGHTDNSGSADRNVELSKQRALTVMNKLVELGVDASRIVAYKGFGSRKPVADNSTEEGRRKNRRTEFVIVRK